MKNAMSWNREDPLSIRIQGTGEYVKEMCSKLVETFEQARQDRLEEIRQDYE